MHGTQETFLWWIVMSKVDKNEWLRTQNIKKTLNAIGTFWMIL